MVGAMKAVVLTAVNQLNVSEVPAPVAGAGEVVVGIKAAALNHRDVWIKAGQYAGLKFPCIPGSDGAGIVTAAGEGVEASWVGREVIINPSFGWGESRAAQGPEFSILGLPRSGTLAQGVAVPVGQLGAKPAHHITPTWECVVLGTDVVVFVLVMVPDALTVTTDRSHRPIRPGGGRGRSDTDPR